MSEETFHPDVLIVGGGAAGFAAAVGASRTGVSVALIERHAYLGGKATAAIVGTVCGLYFRSEQSAKYVMNGFPMAFAEMLKRESQTGPIDYSEGLKFLPYDPFVFKCCCDDMVTETKAEVFFQTSLSKCEVKDKSIHSITVVSLDRNLTFQPKAIIDCTGEALVSTLSGLEVMKCEHYQAPALVFSLENVSSYQTNLNLIMRREIKKAIDHHELDQGFERISLIPGQPRDNRVYLKLGFPKRVTDEVNKVSDLEFFGRKMVRAIAGFLITNVEAFKSAHIGAVASEVGVRTGKRPTGQYTLTEEDVLNCGKFDDGIANGAWPIEFWGDDKAVQMTYFKMDDYYQIPARCLQSNQIENLFFAGRNIASTENAIASARVIGTCLGTGFAAGKMAAFQALGQPMENAIREIRKEQVIL